MGTPAHYASELPRRLGFLVDKLYPRIKDGIEGDNAFGGRLGTTFLLALATPMLLFPIERIIRAGAGRRVMANDHAGDAKLAAKIDDAFAPGRAFGAFDFVHAEAWSYVPGRLRFDLAREWPDELLAELNGEAAKHAAHTIDAAAMFDDLRNALSHGGITYLNGRGRPVYGDEVEMIAFAAHVTAAGRHYNIVRVPEPAFLAFLQGWVRWLNA